MNGLVTEVVAAGCSQANEQPPTHTHIHAFRLFVLVRGILR